MLYVYTVITNGFDNLRPPLVPVTEGVRWVCFTDVPNLPKVEPWESRPLYDLGHPARTTRLPKILPHLLLPEDATASIYHDANFQLKRAPVDIVRELLGVESPLCAGEKERTGESPLCASQYDWAAYRHPARTCIYEEAAVLLQENIGTAALVEAEIARYRASKFSERAGLWANGFLVRLHNERTRELCEAWWRLFAAGCERDQLSFPVARMSCIHNGHRLNSIPGNIYESPYVAFHWHAAWKDREDNLPFVESRGRQRNRIAYLRALVGDRIPKYPDF